MFFSHVADELSTHAGEHSPNYQEVIMNIHHFQHVPYEGLGSITTWAQTNRHQVTVTRFYEGDPLPSMDDLDCLIVVGGPMNVYEEDKYPWLTKEKQFIEEAIISGKVVLGICLGAQLVACVLGAKVYPSPYEEIGWFPVRRTEDAADTEAFSLLPAEIEAFHWHGDTFGLPSGATLMYRSMACENQVFIYSDRVIGLQFHLETTRQSAEKLIQHSLNEIVDGPYIQTPVAMLADDRRFDRINKVMSRLLDFLEHVYRH